MNPGIGKTSKQKGARRRSRRKHNNRQPRLFSRGASVRHRVPPQDADLEIREALPDDAHAIAALYVWHVLNGRASFEEIPPTVDEMRKRIKTVRDNGLPWLVALCAAPLSATATPPLPPSPGVPLYAGRVDLR